MNRSLDPNHLQSDPTSTSHTPIRSMRTVIPLRLWAPDQDAGVIIAEAEAPILSLLAAIGGCDAEMVSEVCRRGKGGYLGIDRREQLCPRSSPRLNRARSATRRLVLMSASRRIAVPTARISALVKDLRYHPSSQPVAQESDLSCAANALPDSVMHDHAEWCRLWIDALRIRRAGIAQSRLKSYRLLINAKCARS